MNKKKVSIFALLLLPVALLSSCSGEPFTDQDFISKLFPNGYWDFLIQLIAFILLILIVFFLGYKPVKKMLQARRDGIQKMVDDVKEDKAIAHKAALEVDQTISEGKEEAARIIAEAKSEAEFQAKQIIDTANAEAMAKRQRADEDIEAAKRASIESTRKEMVDVAMLASAKLLGREVNDKDNERLVKSFVDDVTAKDEGQR